MKWLLLIFIILILILLLIAITKLTIYIDLNHSQDDDRIKIKFSIWFGLLRYTIKIPMVKVDEDTPSIVFKEEKKANVQEQKSKKKKKYSFSEFLGSIQDSRTILERVIGMTSIIKDFISKITISKLEWHSHIGVGDAAHTGVLAGLGWSIKGTLVGLISNYMKLKAHPEYSITPSFQRAVSETKLVCMFHFRIGHAMVAGIRLIKKWRGGVPRFKSPLLSKLNGTDSNKKSV
ncbi:DUF2953 domain-containing protein [Fredinandcohnia sp. 179-A 10B2 NHS]|uniref:DUF2953 domain-containing protein n=1 Tax=Fredinandcohnia sp. 179-A 10B2 NHS TaxID=3235176 RepID=UPI0039A39D07